MENHNGVVIPPRYEEPSNPNNPGEDQHPSEKWLILAAALISVFLFVSFSLYTFFKHQIWAPVIQIESITPSNITSSNTTTIISGNWHLTFSVQNPNKYASVHYRMIQASVSDRDKRLSSGNLDYFYQDKRERGHINVEISGFVVNLEKQRMNDAGQVVLSLKLNAMVWLASEYVKNSWQVLEANCGDVKVRPPMSLKLDGSGRCNVYLY